MDKVKINYRVNYVYDEDTEKMRWVVENSTSALWGIWMPEMVMISGTVGCANFIYYDVYEEATARLIVLESEVKEQIEVTQKHQ